MRRLKILLFWLFLKKNNVGFKELVSFMLKPTVDKIAARYIDSIETSEDTYKIIFKGLQHTLHWPLSFSLSRLYQVVAETFDEKDWHYYQKKHSEVEPGEILLDIGTAEGLFPLVVVNKCNHIYMVEPSTAFNEALKRTFKDYSNKITIFNAAVGNEDGEIFFSEDSLDGKVSEGTEPDAKKISINKIDTLIGNRKITYLKADIEGFEQEMLKGAENTIKNNKPKIAITTYHDENDPEEIIKIIKEYVPEYNYYVKGIYEKSPKPVLIHFWI